LRSTVSTLPTREIGYHPFYECSVTISCKLLSSSAKLTLSHSPTMNYPESPDSSPTSPSLTTELVSEGQAVSKEEWNAWKVGFTPQAEIWNGRVAMLGVSIALVTVLLTNLAR
jgi:hypothetical protein